MGLDKILGRKAENAEAYLPSLEKLEKGGVQAITTPEEIDALTKAGKNFESGQRILTALNIYAGGKDTASEAFMELLNQASQLGMDEKRVLAYMRRINVLKGVSP
jgi:hypothetical protein